MSTRPREGREAHRGTALWSWLGLRCPSTIVSGGYTVERHGIYVHAKIMHCGKRRGHLARHVADVWRAATWAGQSTYVTEGGNWG